MWQTFLPISVSFWVCFFMCKIIFHALYDEIVLIFQLKDAEYYSTYYTDRYCVKLKQSKFKALTCILVTLFLTQTSVINISSLMADQSNNVVN